MPCPLLGDNFTSMSLNRYFWHTLGRNPRKINLSFGNCANYPPTHHGARNVDNFVKRVFFWNSFANAAYFSIIQIIHKEFWAFFSWEIICKLRTVSTSPLFTTQIHEEGFSISLLLTVNLFRISLTNKPTSSPFNQPDHRQKDYM